MPLFPYSKDKIRAMMRDKLEPLRAFTKNKDLIICHLQKKLNNLTLEEVGGASIVSYVSKI